MSSELAQLMEEPPLGPNHGRRAADNPEAEGRHLPLGINDWQAREFMQSGGWSVIHEKDGERAGVGVSAHRGVLHPDEHVDQAALRAMVEHELGFTIDQVHSVYSTGGRIPDQLRGLRERIDARLLALSRSGANMALLGRSVGIPYDPTIKRALRRAQSQEGGAR